jgi:hypothetical protein
MNLTFSKIEQLYEKIEKTTYFNLKVIIKLLLKKTFQK